MSASGLFGSFSLEELAANREALKRHRCRPDKFNPDPDRTPDRWGVVLECKPCGAYRLVSFLETLNEDSEAFLEMRSFAARHELCRFEVDAERVEEAS